MIKNSVMVQKKKKKKHYRRFIGSNNTIGTLNRKEQIRISLNRNNSLIFSTETNLKIPIFTSGNV